MVYQYHFKTRATSILNNGYDLLQKAAFASDPPFQMCPQIHCTMGWQIKAIFGSTMAAGRVTLSIKLLLILGVFEDCEPLGPLRCNTLIQDWMGSDSWLESNVQIVGTSHTLLKNS